MKSRIFLAAVMLVIPFAGFSQVDDMYFVPKKKTAEQKAKQTTVVVEYADNKEIPDRYPDEHVDNHRDVDEYNRRFNYHRSESISNNADSVISEEVIPYEEDYVYSKRLLRFNTPTIGVAVSSPLYWDLCYGPNSIYWDVYDYGYYAYAYPSVWNNWYWGPHYSYSWGYWGHPWYGGWYDPWYRPHWHGPHWGYPGPGHGTPSRPVVRPSTRYRESSTLARGNSTINNRSGRTTTRPAARSGNTNRNTVSNNRNTTTRRSTQPRNTVAPQRSTSPSRNSGYNPSSAPRRSSSPSFSSPSRSGGGGFSPSRSGGSTRGGRR